MPYYLYQLYYLLLFTSYSPYGPGHYFVEDDHLNKKSFNARVNANAKSPMKSPMKSPRNYGAFSPRQIPGQSPNRSQYDPMLEQKYLSNGSPVGNRSLQNAKYSPSQVPEPVLQDHHRKQEHQQPDPATVFAFGKKQNSPVRSPNINPNAGRSSKTRALDVDELMN